MKFDVNRLSRLAGLGVSTSLNEAANRSYHDDPALDKEAEVVHGKGQLSEERGGKKGDRSHDRDYMDEERGGKKGDRSHDRDYMNELSPDDVVSQLTTMSEERGGKKGDRSHKLDYMDEADHDMDEERGGKKGDRSHKRDYESNEMMYRSDEMVQLDEEIIRKELIEMRKEKLQETALRRAIRNEIKDVVRDLDVYATSNWLYGDNKPTRSREGHATMGAPGIGFKAYKKG